jgi:hypothetical protein
MGRGLDLLITKVRQFQLLELVVALLLLLVQLVRITLVSFVLWLVFLVLVLQDIADDRGAVDLRDSSNLFLSCSVQCVLLVQCMLVLRRIEV